MKIKRLKLRNIRSYQSQEIEFGDGITLLSGDIGTGKSTILLAIDFALFGLRKGEISGNILLRKGCDGGEVELNFEIEGQDVVIKRSLKKGSSAISQIAGYMIINGVKIDCTPQELKQKVLELLNYPQELITKNPSFIFRYTVYTPQEEMKQILVLDSESRLNTLRKVFDVDKYKRIVENSSILLGKLREDRREYQGQILYLDEKLKEKEVKQNRINELNTESEKFKGIVDIERLKLESKDNELKEIEDKIKLLNDKKLELNNLEINFRHNQDKIINFREKLEIINSEIESLNNLMQGWSHSDFSQDIKNKIEQIEFKERELRELMDELQQKRVNLMHSQEIKDKICELSNCPTCLQEVKQEYKNQINNREEQNISEIKSKIGEINQKIVLYENEIKIKKDNLEFLREKDKQNEIIKLKKQQYNEKIGSQNKLKIELDELIQKNNQLQGQINNLKIITGNNPLENQYQAQKQEYREIQESYNNKLLKLNSVEKEKILITESLNNLINEINRKINAKNKLEKINFFYNWLSNDFVNMNQSMEKNVMATLKVEFNQIFQKWFSLLIEDIQVNLDNEFTPLMEQNGYEISYEALSGGEKTALALAYRLALSQVLNNLMSKIKTNDLIILDEPTDGFSAEQLDKLKNVLENLEIKQIIIVSHENKIESFVDQVVKLNKQNYISSVLQ